MPETHTRAAATGNGGRAGAQAVGAGGSGWGGAGGFGSSGRGSGGVILLLLLVSVSARPRLPARHRGKTGRARPAATTMRRMRLVTRERDTWRAATSLGVRVGRRRRDVPVGVLILDADLRRVRANRALCEMTGIEDGAVGRPLRDVLPWIPRPTCAGRSRPGSSRGCRAPSAEAGRAAHRFAVSLLPLAAADGAPAVACLVRDVAELVAWRRGLGGIEQLAADLSGAATLADVTDLIVSRSRELVGAETVAAALLTDDGGAFEMVGMAGFDEPTAREWSRFGLDIPTPMGDACGPASRSSSTGTTTAPTTIPTCCGLAEGEAIAAVPIRGAAGVLGAISFRFRARATGSSAATARLMLTIGQHYGQALDRAKLFEAAESERQRLEALMNQLPVGVAIAEAPSGHIVAVNAKATEIWRAPPAGAEPITDVTPYVAFHPDGRRFGTDDWPIARSLATGEVVENEEVDVEFLDGTRGWVNISARPVLDAAGTVLGAVTTLVDVTEPRRRETEARFLAEATDLLTESLDPEEALRRLARLVVPRLADWCVVYIREGSRIRTVALEHSDPKKIELGLDLNRRYPTDPTARPASPSSCVPAGHSSRRG